MENEIDYTTLGIKIKNLRKEKNFTQDKLAELVGCNTSHISNIENSYTKVSLNILLSIANVLETSIDFLLCEQYESSSTALETEILRVLKECDEEKKHLILKIICAIK